MHIKRRTLGFFPTWLAIVFLVGINIGVFTTHSQSKEQYQSHIEEYEREQMLELTHLQYQVGFYNEIFEEVEPFTPQQQETIDFINSGYEYETSTSSSSNPDCSEYEKPWRKFTGGGNCGFVLSHAAGDMKLLIVEFASPQFDVLDEQNQMLISTLHAPRDVSFRDDESYPSYQYLKTFYEAQSRIFGNDEFSLSVEYTDIISLNDFPNYQAKTRPEQLGEIEMSRTFFLHALSFAHIDVRDYDAVAVVVFVDDEDPQFISFALPGVRANVNRIIGGYDFYSSDGELSLISHETAHLFGARDQYIQASGECQEGSYDEYIVQGETRNLMCALGSLRPESDDYAAFNTRAAREMGWLSQ